MARCWLLQCRSQSKQEAFYNRHSSAECNWCVASWTCIEQYFARRPNPHASYAGLRGALDAGTDHAGIATQAVVERRLKEQENVTRHELGRDKLVQRIWDWKDQYEKRILGQLKRLGASCDWRRTRFTLDDQCAKAVQATFFDLFKKDLIYRGKRLVNWDTFLQTAVSDDEVFHETVKGSFWHIQYPVIDPKAGEPKFVTVATTRPETMLGDTAVAVHPDPAADWIALKLP